MACPVSRACRDLVVELAERSLLLCRDPIPGDHQKVAVALEITGSERERAGQVGADEVVAENRMRASHQLSQQLVQLRKGRRPCTRHRGIEPPPVRSAASAAAPDLSGRGIESTEQAP